MGHQCCSGRRKLLVLQIPGPEQFPRQSWYGSSTPRSCILIKQTSRWAALLRAAQMDHSSFQQTKHPPYVLLRRQLPFGPRHRHQPRQSSRHHVNKHQSRHQHNVIHMMASSTFFQWWLSSTSWPWPSLTGCMKKVQAWRRSSISRMPLSWELQAWWNRTMRNASYFYSMTSLNHWNRRRGASEHRERRWSLQPMTRWTLLRLPSKSYSLPKRQRRSSPTFLVMSYRRNTKDPRKSGGRKRYHRSDRSTPLIGWVDVRSQSWGGRHHDSFACNWRYWWLHSERHRCVVAWHWRTYLANGPCGSWTTWCIHKAKFPQW